MFWNFQLGLADEHRDIPNKIQTLERQMCLGMLGFKVYQIIMRCKEDDKHVCVCLSAGVEITTGHWAWLAKFYLLSVQNSLLL